MEHIASPSELSPCPPSLSLSPPPFPPSLSQVSGSHQTHSGGGNVHEGEVGHIALRSTQLLPMPHSFVNG